MTDTLLPSHHDVHEAHPYDSEPDGLAQRAIVRGGGFEIARWDYRSVHGVQGHAFAIGHRHHFVAFVAAPTNVSVIFQFVSQLLPPSFE
jgi:hypothetical protein